MSFFCVAVTPSGVHMYFPTISCVVNDESKAA